MHLIPHLGLGSFGDNNRVYLFLPGLFFGTQSETEVMSDYRLCAVYFILRRSLDQFLPSTTRGLKRRRKIVHSIVHDLPDDRTVDVGPPLVEDWSRYFIREIAQHPRLGGEAFFGILVHDSQACTVHNILGPPSYNEAQNRGRKSQWRCEERNARNLLLQDLMYTDEELYGSQARWNVNAVLRIALPVHIVQWYKPSHGAILAFILQVNDRIGQSISSCTEVNTVASLTDCAGFRLDIPPENILYAKSISAHCTDQSAIRDATPADYVNDLCGEMIAASLQSNEFGGGGSNELIQWLTTKINIYQTCLDLHRDGAACLDVLVPLSKASEVLPMGLGTDLLRSSTLRFPSWVLW